VKWHRRRGRRSAEIEAGPVLIGDVWVENRGRPVDPGWLSLAAATWRRRLGAATRTAGRVVRSVVGTEARSMERRAVTSLPWDQGGPLHPAAVGVDRALRLGPVFAAGRLLADAVASLPLQQYRKTGDMRQRVPLASLFAAPSTQGTLHDWIYRAVTSLAYRGNAIGLITARDYYEYPTMIEWLNPDDVQVIDSNPSGPGSFTNPLWYWRGKQMDPENLLHIPWFVLPNRVWGLSPIGAYAATVNVGLAAQQYTADWFDSGGAPVGTFKNTAKTITQDEAGEMKRRLVGAIRSHQPIVHGADWEYNAPISISQHDAMFVETMRLGATQIATIYGIPPSKLGGETGGSSVTYANVEQESIDFAQFTLMPWLTKLEAAFAKIMPGPQYVKFNVDALIRPDATTRFQNYRTARDIGLMNIDEMRALEDLEPLPGGRGHDYTPLQIMTKAAGAAQAPVDPPAGARQLELVEDVDDDERGSDLKFGRGSALWRYWTKGKGLARWIDAAHKWTTLHRLLLEEGVPAREAAGLATNIIEAVLPGYMAQAHSKKSS
jgi:HK97 family phage portal protein